MNWQPEIPERDRLDPPEPDREPLQDDFEFEDDWTEGTTYEHE